MPDLSFRVESVEPVPHAVAPTLNIKLRASNAVPDEPVQAAMLHCQVRINPVRRSYTAAEQEALRDLFGEPERWGQSLQSMLWANTTTMLQAFDGSTIVDMPVPCTFDFNIAITKYFHALEDGNVPLELLFSGTVFHKAQPFGLQVSQIPWDREAAFLLPVRVWKEMMDLYYPNIAWLSLSRDVFDQLYRYKISQGLPTFEQAVERLIQRAEEPDS